MNDFDKESVEAAQAWAFLDYERKPKEVIDDLLGVIKRLDAENEKLKADLDRAVNALVNSYECDRMNEQKIKKRLERYKRWRRDRSLEDYVGPPFFNHDADWLIDELERQLDRNHHLNKQLAKVKEAWEPFRKARQQMGEHYPDYYVITFTHPIKGMELRVGDFRRLDQALEEVKAGAK